MAITFDGTSLPYAHFEEGPTSEEIKEINYPGVDGTAQMTFGERKQTFIVKGFLEQATSGNKNALKSKQFTIGTLATDDGRGSWQNVYFRAIRFDNFIKDCTTGYITCEYTAEFDQLAPSN